MIAGINKVRELQEEITSEVCSNDISPEAPLPEGIYQQPTGKVIPCQLKGALIRSTAFENIYTFVAFPYNIFYLAFAAPELKASAPPELHKETTIVKVEAIFDSASNYMLLQKIEPIDQRELYQ